MDQGIEMKSNVKNDEEKNPPEKRKKLRGKTLHKIKEQMEFYFSHANLRRDRFLGNLVRSSPGGYVKTEIFLTFNQIRKLTDDSNDIIKAISHSNVLEVTSDGKNIRVKDQESDKVKNYDECTIYVERLPEFCDYKYVKNIFSKFGHINYVSLPRFRNSNKIKGFSFVEFDNPDSCKQACDAYKTKKESKSLVNNEHKPKINESKKKSTDSSPEKNDHVSQKSPRKRKRSESEKSPEKHQKSASIPTKEEERAESGETPSPSKGSCKKNKKRKRQSSESETVEKKRVRFSSESAIDKAADREEDGKHTLDDAATFHTSKELSHKVLPDREKVDEIPAKKVKMEHANDITDQPEDKKDDLTTKDDEVSKDQAEATDQDGSQKEKKKGRKKKGESDKLELRVLTRAEWKQYKNRYLSMQKRAMSSLKKMLLVNKKQQAECEAMLSKDDEQAMEVPAEEPKDVKVSVDKIEFQPGVIVKLTLTKTLKVPSSDLIKNIKSKTHAAFVDVVEANGEAFVRFTDNDAANETMELDSLNEFGSAKLITGIEESEYWKKLEQDRETHFNRVRTNKRGRDKIIAKAMALTKQKSMHIHFDEQL